MLFQAISGYTWLKKRLLNHKKASTLLFTGPSGSASLALALAYITYLHCMQPAGEDACGRCVACKKMARLTHADLYCTFPIGTTQAIKGKDLHISSFLPLWRECIIENPYSDLKTWSAKLKNEAKNLQIGKAQAQTIKHTAGLRPFESRYKTILIWLPELLHPSAANALLKTLEEPSAYTFFILVSADASQILLTIRSRSLEVYVPGFTHEDMVSAIKLHYPNLTPARYTALAKVAQGDLNKAKALAQVPIQDYFDQFVAWLRAVYILHWTRIVHFSEAFYRMPVQVQKNWITYGLQVIRGALLIHFDQERLIELSTEELSLCTKLAKLFTSHQMVAIVSELEGMHYKLKRNANAKLLVLNSSFHIAQLIKPGKV